MSVSSGGLEKDTSSYLDVGEATACCKLTFVVVHGTTWFVVHYTRSAKSSVWFRAQLTGFPCSAGNHGGRAVFLWTPRT